MYHVLWLASWYPNRTDIFNGDFIERHAKAVSELVKITVLFVTKDETMKPGTFTIEKTTEKNLTVYRGYYGKSSRSDLLEKILSFKKYKQCQKIIYRQIEMEQGKPDLVHVQVALKAGILALRLQQQFQIPYLVTEHWSGYFPGSYPNIYSANSVLKKLNKQILQSAGLLLPVTKNLGETINSSFVKTNFTVIPNVVNTSLFFYHPVPIQRFRFIHPSGMDANKNPERILLACKLVKEKGYDFELLMVGKMDEPLISLAKQYGIYENTVLFEPAIPYTAVAKEMQRSSALLLFSRFESLPCVILEALCSGLPVISSNVGGIGEVINESNGILVEKENVDQLAIAMSSLMDNYSTYNRASIAAEAVEQFNYNTVAKQYAEAYTKILNPIV